MTPERTTRRTVPKSTAGLVTGAALPATASAAEGWTAVESPTDTTLHDVADTSAGAYTIGGGKVYDLTSGRWEEEATPTGENLKAVVRGSPDIAVGAGGTVVER